MADELPRADESKRGSRRWVRTWIAYEEYESLHLSHMENLYREGLILDDTLTFAHTVRESGELVRVNLTGIVHCRGDVTVEVSKWLAVQRGSRNRVEVKTEFYLYHAHHEVSGARVALFRYDNAHGELHRHWFDQAGRETHVEDIPLETMPRMDAVLREAVATAEGSARPG